MEELLLIDYLLIVKRWRKIFAIAFSAVFFLAVLFTATWSNYRAEATVQIEEPQVQSDVTTPLSQTGHTPEQDLADRRISSLQEKVTSTASLIEIITKFNLYSGARADTPIAVIAEKMRKKIKVEMVASTTTGSAASRNATDKSAVAFVVSFSYSDPLLTQQVTDELTSRFLDQDLKDRRTQAQETTAFLDSQIEEMEKSLTEQEHKIAEYQKTHGISRPETLAFNQQAAANWSLSLQSIETQIATNDGNLGNLRSQIASVDPYSRVVADGQMLTSPTIQLKALQSQYAALTAQYGANHPDVQKTRRQIEALQGQIGTTSGRAAQIKKRIIDVRTNLEAARKTYGDGHPDVLSLQNQLSRLEDQLAMTPARDASGDGFVADADNPLYLQLSTQIKTAMEQRKSLMAQRHEIQEQLNSYQNAIVANPETAKELAALTRDYDNAQLRYRELRAKKQSADMEEKLQEGRKGEKLTLINPPELPLSTKPAKILLAIAGTIMAFGCGLAAVILMQLMAQCIVGKHHLETIVGAPPLVSIPHISTKTEKENTLFARFCRSPLAIAAKEKGIVFWHRLRAR